MQNEQLTVYKLVILFMLKKVDFPLNTSQFSQFFVDRDYTDFLTLQQSLKELHENHFIESEMVRNMSQYTLTDDGREALEMFQYKISDGLQDDVLDFFAENQYQLRNEVEVYSQYFPISEDNYMAECVIKEANDTILNIKLNVPTKDQAVAVCDSWRDRSNDVYKFLIDNLILGEPSSAPQDDENADENVTNL